MDNKHFYIGTLALSFGASINLMRVSAMARPSTKSLAIAWGLWTCAGANLLYHF